MLIPFAHYRRRHAVGVYISIAILNALLLLGLATKTTLTPAELAFALIAIVGGVSYASLRDLPGHLIYCGQSPKFYRDEADFALLARYARGWRQWLALVARPLPSAIVLAGGLTGLNAVCSTLWPGLWTSAIVLLLASPFTLSWLVWFLAPLLVGWQEVEARSAPYKDTADIRTIPQRIRGLATQDLLVTSLITAALVLPVRHNPGFQPSPGYGSVEFMLAALILVMIVLPLTLVSAWRSRRLSCSGELYRSHLPALTPLPVLGNGSRWSRWCRYSLLLCGLTPLTCLGLGALHPSAPIELVLLLLLAPLAPVFWIERRRTLVANFQDAAHLVNEFPLYNMPLERMLELTKGA